MIEFHFIQAFITAGISLAMGSISLFLGLKNKNKTDLVFGLMTTSLFIFLFVPPIGFIVDIQPPYPYEILIKRIFIFAYYGLMPWFIYYYTDSKSKKVPMLISISVCIIYVAMATTKAPEKLPLWVWGALFVYGANFSFGLIEGIKQYEREKVKTIWFLSALSIFGILFVLTALSQFGIELIEQFFDTKLFFSIHLHALFLILVMGFRMVVNIEERYRFEKALRDKDSRWQSFMHFAPMFVLELNERGNIIFINDFGVKLLGYENPKELDQLNWCDNFLSISDAKICKAQFARIIETKKSLPYHRTTIKNRIGEEHIINWLSFLTFSEESNSYSIVSVGTDITQTESTSRLINQLKLELEKEKIVFPENEPVQFGGEIIGKSDAIRYAIDKAKQVANTTAPVLLEGETGVGKELIADLIHNTSLRKNAPIVKVNCGALPKELIEDELFGHEKGAFTSAIQSRKGRFELADGGTIFLDEIGELPLEMQPKLLRVLQNGEFERVGGQKTIKVDVRVIAATNRDLTHEVQQGNFRDDLFYRLNVFPITIPPLRKRKEDLPLLINHFINLKAKKYNKQLDQISKADLQRVMEYAWPGNVRELINVIERSVIASEGNTLKLEWFFEEHGDAIGATSLEDVERQHIIKVMEACHWKINGENGAAEKLNMHPNTLRSKMKKLGINRPVKDLF